jgi:hypothetical protein
VTVPAGWYPDPNGQTRWWDGYRWTESVQQQWAPTTAPSYVTEGTPTSTLWIWLIACLPVVTAILTFTMLGVLSSQMSRAFESALAQPGVADSTLGLRLQLEMYSNPAFLVSSLGGWVVFGAGVLFAYFDQRELKRRGYPRTFHWAWNFLSPVYIIGRAVVVRRQTGRGLAPLWTFIALTVLWIAIYFAWIFQFMGELMGMVSQQYGA